MRATLTSFPSPTTAPRGSAMPHSPADCLTVLEHGLDRLEGVVQRTTDLGERAAVAAGVLRSLVPDALLCVCRLTRDGQSHTAVVDRAGDEQPDARLDELAGD